MTWVVIPSIIISYNFNLKHYAAESAEWMPYIHSNWRDTTAQLRRLKYVTWCSKERSAAVNSTFLAFSMKARRRPDAAPWSSLPAHDDRQAMLIKPGACALTNYPWPRTVTMTAIRAVASKLAKLEAALLPSCVTVLESCSSFWKMTGSWRCPPQVPSAFRSPSHIEIRMTVSDPELAVEWSLDSYIRYRAQIGEH